MPESRKRKRDDDELAYDASLDLMCNEFFAILEGARPLNPELSKIVIEGDLRAFNNLLLQIGDFDFNAIDDEGNTLIHLIMIHGYSSEHKEILAHLLNISTINPNVNNYGGFAPIHLATCKTDFEFLTILLTSTLVDVDSTAQNDQNDTALNLSIRRNMNFNFDILLKRSSQRTIALAIRLAAETGNLTKLTWFLENRVNDDLNDFLGQYKSIILSDLRPTSLDTKPAPVTTTLREIVYNQDKYDTGVLFPSDSRMKLGHSISLDSSTPIGYNIYLPEGEIKSVIVNVYGGTCKYDRTSEMFKPTPYLNQTSLFFVQQGIAYIELNLIDLLELEHHQRRMPENIHTRLHASIDKFYRIIHYSPEALHPSCKKLRNKSLFLMGASYGGRTAVKQAELYPRTYSGYISYEGALSAEMALKSDVYTHAFQYQEWLCPKRGIEKICDPVMVIHNFDDNNVNVKVTLDWYNKALSCGKKRFIHLLINPNRSPITTPEINIGHSYPQDPSVFNWLMNSIVDFTQQDLSKTSTLSSWRALKYDILANKNNKSSSLQDHFVSKVYRLYKNRELKSLDLSDVAPYLYSLYCINNITSEAFSKHLEILNALSFVDDNAIRLIVNLEEADLFINFLKQRYLLIDNATFDTTLKLKEALFFIIKDALLGKNTSTLSKNVRDTFVRWFFWANPSQCEFFLQLNGLKHSLEPMLNEAHQVVINTINLERKNIAHLWQQIAKRVHNELKPKAILNTYLQTEQNFEPGIRKNKLV